MGIANILSIEKIPVDISFLSEYKVGLSGSLTQSVEYLTFNQRVARSSRARPTSFCPHRLARFRTSAFHADNTGSNPVGDAKKPKIHYGSWLFFAPPTAIHPSIGKIPSEVHCARRESYLSGYPLSHSPLSSLSRPQYSTLPHPHSLGSTREIDDSLVC